MPSVRWPPPGPEPEEIREELKRIVKGNVLDMSFEEEVVRQLAKGDDDEVYYTVDEEGLHDNQWSLRKFGEVLTMLADCIDQIQLTEHVPLFFEFFIPR